MRYHAELEQRFFSAVQFAVAAHGTLTGHHGEGTTAFTDGVPVTAETFFDLASLTKALFIAPAYYFLFARGDLSPEDTLDRFFPEQRPVVLRRLLNHTSGYPAYREFFRDAPDEPIGRRRRRVLDHIAAIEEISPPVYSDLNYLLLGFVLEAVWGKPLEQVWHDLLDEVGFPAGRILFATRPLLKQHCAATMFSPVRGRICHGEVEDENCFYLGGVTGHAGLFGTAGDVAVYLTTLLEKSWFRAAVDTLDAPGFDRPEGTDSHYGRTAPASRLGHLGFTGTAFALDPDTGKAAVLLTNRTHPDPEKERWRERIKAVRQELFDTLLPR